jgi:excisionase family DNA binding protein
VLLNQNEDASAVPLAPQNFRGFECYVTSEEAAEFLKVTPRRLKDMARAGAIPAHPVDPGAERREWRFLLSELRTWMQDNSSKKRRL